MKDKKPEDIISDAAVLQVHANANFGDISPRDTLDQGLLSAAFGWYQGYTITIIMQEHGLLRKNGRLTKKGFLYLQTRWKYQELIDTPAVTQSAEGQGAPDFEGDEI